VGNPLIFVFRDVVSGRGFLAGVTIAGRCLLEEENGKWVIYGVRPGAIAECGKTPHEVLLGFRRAYTEVLFDIAEESATYEKFKEEIERFYYEPDRQEEVAWEKALTAVRSGQVEPPEALAGLPRANPETRPSQISVECLNAETQRVMPSDNVVDSYLLPLAA